MYSYIIIATRILLTITLICVLMYNCLFIRYSTIYTKIIWKNLAHLGH